MVTYSPIHKKDPYKPPNWAFVTPTSELLTTSY